MKKLVLAMAAALLVSLGAMAQGTNDRNGGRRGQFNRTEMAQQQRMTTDEIVKKYGLNEEQAAKLQELNTKYLEKMRGNRPERMLPRDSNRVQRVPADSVRQQRGRGQGQGADRRNNNNFEEMRKAREAYAEELKSILTPEQYEAYQADQKKMLEQRRGAGARNGQRPQRRQNNN